MKAIVVDDEELAREALLELLNPFTEIEVVDTCRNGFELIEKVKLKKPDVIFLDIHMPQLDGFEVLELLGNDAPAIIFVTAYDEFALKAFEANALDYLLKPINRSRLEKSIEKLISQKGIIPKSYEKVLKSYKEQSNLNRVLVKDGSNVHVIPVNEIIWLEAQDDYVAIHTNKNLFLKLERLGNFEATLDERVFKRIHRSFIVNMDYVQRIENQKWAVLNSGKKLPVSKSGYSRYFGK